MRSTLRCRNYVHEAPDLSFIASSPAQRYVNAAFALNLSGFHRTRLFVQDRDGLAEGSLRENPLSRDHLGILCKVADVLFYSAVVLEGKLFTHALSDELKSRNKI